MLKLRDIMTSDVLTVSSDQSVRDVLDLFTSRHVSGAPVMDGAKVVGVISASDLLSSIATLPDVIAEDSAATPGEPSIEWEDDTAPMNRFYTEAWDEIDVGEQLGNLGRRERSALDDLTVAEVMTTGTIHQQPSETAVELAAEYMHSADIHRLLVIDEGKLVGIVSTTDIVEAVAGRRLTALRYVFPRRETGVHD